MKKFSPYEVLLGVNNMWHFVHQAQLCGNHCPIPMREFYQYVTADLKWSIINPGSVLICAYAYFVYGQEKKLLDDFLSSDEGKEAFLAKFTVADTSYEKLTSNKEKVDYIKRRLRNSLAHCRYSVEVRTESGKIRNDGDVYYVFEDEDGKGGNKTKIEISFPSFANIIQATGKFGFKKLKQR